MNLVFGLDGGGTSTRLRIADEDNRSIWEGSGSGINPNATPINAIAERLEVLFGEGYRATGLSAQDFAGGCLGVAGADRPGERAELTSLFRERLGISCPLEVAADSDIALVGGLRRCEGFLLVAGTGSIAIARLADGTRFRSGGLGHFLGDEGSAFFIGFEAMRRSLRSVEGRDVPTAMLEPLLLFFGLENATEFVPLVYRRFDKALIAGAADLAERYRAAGDELAVSIMDEARDELVRLVVSARAQASGMINEPSLVLSGGLFEHNAWLRDSVSANLAETCPDLAQTPPLENATFGACLLALSRLGQ